MKFIYAAILMLLMPFTASASNYIQNTDEIELAMCQVFSGGGSGTGFFYKETNDNYFLLTNGHVTASGGNYSIRLYREGDFSRKIPARLIQQHYQEGTSRDFSILSISRQSLQVRPKIIKLAKNVNKQRNDIIVGWGVPLGDFSVFWRGRVIQDKQHSLEVSFPFISGMSGGPAVDAKTLEAIGLVTWRYPQTKTGGIVSANMVWTALDGNRRVNFENTNIRIDREYKLLSNKDPVCEHCGKKLSEHYHVKKDGKLDLENPFCPTSENFPGIETQCGPNGCPPNYQQGGDWYYRRGGGIHIGGPDYFGYRQPQPSPYGGAPQPQPRPGPGQGPGQGGDFWIYDTPDSKPEVTPDDGPMPINPEDYGIKPEVEPEEDKPEEAETTSWLGNWDDWKQTAIYTALAFVGGISIPALMMKFGAGPLVSRVVGGAVQRRVRSRINKNRRRKTAYHEYEYEDDDDEEYVPVKKKNTKTRRMMKKYRLQQRLRR